MKDFGYLVSDACFNTSWEILSSCETEMYLVTDQHN